jgi:SAM-dependent methyltransferase
MKLDWGIGDYAATGRQLEPAAAHVVALAGITSADRVLDVGCGNGNAAIEAARCGARVSGIDPSSRLVAEARRRAEAAGLDGSFAVGEAALIDAPDGAFDAVLSVFAVIFAEDPKASVTEMVRVTKPGGRLAIASWVPEGAVHELSLSSLPPASSPPPSPWRDEPSIRGLFTGLPVELDVRDAELILRAPSAEAWFQSLERDHPFWIWVQSARADWQDVRQRCLELLEARNEDPSAFAVTSRYRVTLVRRVS